MIWTEKTYRPCLEVLDLTWSNGPVNERMRYMGKLPPGPKGFYVQWYDESVDPKRWRCGGESYICNKAAIGIIERAARKWLESRQYAIGYTPNFGYSLVGWNMDIICVDGNKEYCDSLEEAQAKTMFSVLALRKWEKNAKRPHCNR